MPKGVYQHKQKQLFQKGHHPKTEFRKGNKSRSGETWRVKDTSKMKGKQNAKGHHKTKEQKMKIREWQINHPNRKFSNTIIEQKIAKELTKRGIYYQQNIGLCNIANVDFYLPEYRIVIECDGCYYHACPEHGSPKHHQDASKIDARKTEVLRFHEFKVFRFWGHEINKSPEECINMIKL